MLVGIKILLKMKKVQKNDESLESRRDFFKKAAKAALPILGFVALAGAPQILGAAESTKTGCDYTCKLSCQNDCYGTCRHTCKTRCTGSCVGYCRYGCSSSMKH